jgi:hypothetical protein
MHECAWKTSTPMSQHGLLLNFANDSATRPWDRARRARIMGTAGKSRDGRARGPRSQAVHP